jgi:hypothetical protein
VGRASRGSSQRAQEIVHRGIRVGSMKLIHREVKEFTEEVFIQSITGSSESSLRKDLREFIPQ